MKSHNGMRPQDNLSHEVIPLGSFLFVVNNLEWITYKDWSHPVRTNRDLQIHFQELLKLICKVPFIFFRMHPKKLDGFQKYIDLKWFSVLYINEKPTR